ncbi:hypothetical protein D3C85_1880730 [compost metagenome]
MDSFKHHTIEQDEAYKSTVIENAKVQKITCEPPYESAYSDQSRDASSGKPVLEP